jgi:C4-dicarboxylate transporter DctM subunit
MITFGILLGIATLAIGVPIFIVFGLSGGVIVSMGLNLPWSTITQITFEATTKYILLAIPLFIFAGALMIDGGLAQRLVGVFSSFVGHLRGGLAISLVLAMAFFGAISGSILAAIVAIGGVLIPIMEEKGYSKAYAAALTAASAGLASLIPPSNGAIIFCAITGASVAKAFMAGILPGLVNAGLLIILIIFQCRKMEPLPPAKWKERWLSLYHAIPAILSPVIILGGIYAGIFTPTEAAAVSCVWAVIVGVFFYRELTWAKMGKSLKTTVIATSIIFALIATASFLSVAFSYTRFPQNLTNFLLSVGVSPLSFLLMSALVCLILGFFIEVVPIMYLTIPIMLPMAIALKVDLLHLYIATGAFIGLGLLTPPVCVGAYTAAATAQIPATLVIKALFPWFFIVGIVYGIICIFWPEMILLIPNMMKVG